MYGEQHQAGYRNGRSGGGSSNANTNSANGASGATKAPPSIPQRRSGAGGKQGASANGSSSNNTNVGGSANSSNAVAAVAAAAAAAPAPPSTAATVASPSPAAPATMPLAAPRSQQLASPRSPADYQSSPTVNSPHGSPGTRSYYGSAFASPNSPNGGGGSGLYGKTDAGQRSGLERLVLEEGLVQTNVPLQELRTMPGTNTVKVGYDGTTILRNVTESVQEQDPMTVFTVTTPMVLYSQQDELVNEVSAVAEAVSSPTAAAPRAFSPVFVFDGIPLSPLMDSPNAPVLSPPTEITLFHGQTPNHAAKVLTFNMKKLVAERFRIDDDVEAYFIRTLRVSFPEVFRAPYNAWAQLSAFFSPTNRYISEVYGSLELLAFPGIDRVITKFNPESQTFDYVDKQAVLAAFNRRATNPIIPNPGLTERDLAYIILTDTQQKPYRLHFMPDSPSAFDELIVKFAASEPLPDGRGRGYSFAKNYYYDRKQQLNANYALLDAPVFTHDASVLPLYTVYGTAPHSCLRARGTFGAPLPPVLYFGLFSGLVMPNSLAAIGHGLLSDRWPLIDSVEFRKLLEFLVPIRLRTCLHLLAIAPSIPLPARWYRAYMAPKAVVKEKIIDILVPDEVPLYDWNLAGNTDLQEQESQYFLNVLPFYVCSMLPPMDGAVPAYYRTVAETTASVLLKTFDQLGYFTHSVEEDSTQTPIGLSTDLSICAEAMRYFSCETLSEYGLLCLELLRTQALHDDPIHYTPVSTRQYQKDHKPGVRFASRLLSLIPICINETWGGPFDPEIAAFGVIARTLSRTIRMLMESITVNTFCSHRTTVPMSDMGEVLNRLPFGLPTEFGAGHLMNYILHNEDCTMEELTNVFPECSALYDDLATLFWFWSMAIPAIRTLAEEAHNIDVGVVHAANEAVIAAAVRLDPQNFGYLEQCRDEVKGMMRFAVGGDVQEIPNGYTVIQQQQR